MRWRRKPRIIIDDGHVLVFTDKRLTAKRRDEVECIFRRCLKEQTTSMVAHRAARTMIASGILRATEAGLLSQVPYYEDALEVADHILATLDAWDCDVSVRTTE
jgi:hypothetical protein